MLPSHKDDNEKQKQSGGKDEQFWLFVLFVLRKGFVSLNNLLRAVWLSVLATPGSLKSVSDVYSKIPLFLRRWLCPCNYRLFPIHRPAWSRCAWSRCRSVAHPRFSFVTGARESRFCWWMSAGSRVSAPVYPYTCVRVTRTVPHWLQWT